MRHAAWLLIFCAFVVPPPATAAAPDAALAVDEETLKAFEAIETLAAQAAYAEAEAKIQSLLPDFQDNPGIRALLLRNLATLYGLQKHYRHAAETIRQSLDLQALPAGEAAKAAVELGQYYVAAGQYQQGAAALAQRFSQSPASTPEPYLLLADLYTRLEHYNEASVWLEKAIAQVPKPKPEWRQQLLGLYHESRNFDGCAKILSELIAVDPNNALYWNQLTGIYQEAGNELYALAVKQLMHQKGLLNKPDEIEQLAEVLRYHGLPSRAAELLQSELENKRLKSNAEHFELLADAWTEAQEYAKAAAALEKAAAEYPSGNTYLRLGQLYSELKEWSKARQALTKALSLGGIKNTGGVYLLLGLANYKLNAKDQARSAFMNARNTSGAAKTAEQWLEHLAKEVNSKSLQR